MIPIAAYADRLSVRPGETIRFQVANASGETLSAKLVRVICADANPDGPGIRVESVDATPDEIAEAAPQTVPRGSYARIEGVDTHLGGGSFSFVCRFRPTLLKTGNQVLAARGEAAAGFALAIDVEGRLCVQVAGSAEPVIDEPLIENRWYGAWVTWDIGRHALGVGCVALHAELGQPGEVRTQAVQLGSSVTLSADGPLLLAAADHVAPHSHFNGRIESPLLYGRALQKDEALACVSGQHTPPDAIAHWDFADGFAGQRIADMGPHGLHGVLVNCPVRGVPGSNWRAREMCYLRAPEEFGAIHFHEDDIDDCDWPTVYEWTVPEGTRSAVYALVLAAGDEGENVPFHVVPPKGTRSADIAVLASTFTYTIYGNHARPDWFEPDWRNQWEAQAKAWGGYPYHCAAHPEYGWSTYNFHTDGSGISIASWHRPMLNVRVGYNTFPDAAIRGSGLRHFPADSHLVHWLETKGHDYDIITDWELHHEGVEVLRDYPVVLTGSHPEYHTRETLDALTAYRDGGGRFCYLGGNGFYWKVALSPERDGVIEIRRGEGGIRAWAAEPGEYYNQFDGEYGGLWRRNGRPPQDLSGIGFTAQGHFLGSYYRRRPEAVNARVAWILDGVEGDIIGDHGLSGHGAAGFELDRADKRLGTPRHAIVLASSENHPPDAPWVLVPEEILSHLHNWPGESTHDLIRADMTFFETPAGGAVFSAGSITFCGSLPTNNCDNDVSTILDNVIRRFLDPTPFNMPD